MEFASAQLLMLLQWMDSAFPTGTFAHSMGLETYAQVGGVTGARALAELIAARLESASTTDMIAIHSAITAYHAGDLAALRNLDGLCAASKMARETREASEKIGRRMLASVLNVYHDGLLGEYRAALERGESQGHHAVVHGIACAALGIEARAALLAFGYGLAANQTAASLKLMAIGQTQAQAVLGAAGGGITSAVETALTLTLDDFGAFTPGLDIRSMQHEQLFQRLFIS